jgi:hypothetical protein
VEPRAEHRLGSGRESICATNAVLLSRRRSLTLLLGSGMNAARALACKLPVRRTVWVISLLASMVVGDYAGRTFVSAGVWQPSGRACPEGWIGIAIGAGLVGCGIFLGRRWRAHTAAFLCGVGLGFLVWPALLILYTKVAPSC